MRYADLHLKWDRSASSGSPSPETLAEADGCVFWCPKCRDPKAHAVKLWFLGVPAEVAPKIGRWRKGGTSEHDFSLLPNPQPNGEDGRSVKIPMCGAHFNIDNGIVEMLN